MKEEHGLDVFFGGCPVCKELCCCNNKSVFCHRKNHCYRKCPATKTNGKNATACGPVKDDSDSEPAYQEEHMNIPKPENGQYGIFDLLAAVADMDKTNPTLGKTSKNSSATNSNGNVARKKPKLAKDSTGSASNSKGGFPNTMLLCEPSYSSYYSTTGGSGGGVESGSSNNMQLLHNSKQSPNLTGTSQTVPIGLSGDSGVDGYTFNNNTMGIIRGGINGADAITLMGQQKQKYSALDKLSNMSNENLLSGTSSAATSGAATLTSSTNAPNTSVLSSIYSRLPSIDSNPFSITSVKDSNRVNATFDQALLDSVRNIQSADSSYHMALGQPLPSVPRALNQQAAALAGDSNSNSSKNSAMASAALEPMNLLALVSSFTQSIDKGLPSEHLLLSGAEDHTRTGGRSATDSKAASRGE